MNIVITILVFVICGGIGAYLLIRSLRFRQESRQAQKWPTITGLMLKSEIVEDPIRNFAGSIKVASSLDVSYQYEVKGKTYEGSKLCFGSPVFSYLDASNAAEQFQVGKKVPVHYNPEDPQQSVLAPKTTIGMPSYVPAIFLLLVGIVIPVVSVLVDYWRR